MTSNTRRERITAQVEPFISELAAKFCNEVLKSPKSDTMYHVDCEWLHGCFQEMGLEMFEHFAEAYASRSSAPEPDPQSVWLVELFHEGKSDGFWVGPPKDEGGWRTQNAWAAKRYTENEAKAVAAALDYFPAPFRWSHWVATEHIFRGLDYVRAAST